MIRFLSLNFALGAFSSCFPAIRPFIAASSESIYLQIIFGFVYPKFILLILYCKIRESCMSLRAPPPTLKKSYHALN
jgi:hypothetical protein